MVDSIHVARWIAQFQPNEIEFVLFPSTPNRRVHSKIREMISKNHNITIVPFGGHFSIPLWGIDLLLSNYIRGFLLRRVLKKMKPDFVHSLELQHGGYITSRALEDQSLKTPFIATNYGSDIYWFQQFPRHVNKIQKLLSRADRYSAECNRDVTLARKYGFSGDVMPVFPNAGGFSEEIFSMAIPAVKSRKTIAVKGYDGWAGQAILVAQALSRIPQIISGFDVVFYSCNYTTIRKIKKLNKNSEAKFKYHKKNALTHQEVLNLFRKARIYVGASRTDGISTSALEAMACGAFPIQSSSSCLAEWVTYGKTALSIDEDTPKGIAERVTWALKSEDFLTEAMEENLHTIRTKLSYSQISALAETFYQS